jgi:hypothetical protein
VLTNEKCVLKFKKTVNWFLLLLHVNVAYAQHSHEVRNLLHQLDSVKQGGSVARYFAGIYLTTTVHASDYFSLRDSIGQQLMGRMELRFATYFFQAAKAFQNGEPIPEAWRPYFNDTIGGSLRHILYGINAHINGDIWQALTAEFSSQELEQLKPYYFGYFRQLLDEYQFVCRLAVKSSRFLRLLHILSFGADQVYGRVMLKRWRKRQMRLAELYFRDKYRFERERNALQRAISRINRLIRIYS